jgi:predicted P-loop ATPase
MAALIGIELCDPTTFQTHRLMYWPSCSADSPYVYYATDKPMLDVDGALGRYTDWRNVAEWPQVPGTEQQYVKLAAKQGDPLDKAGVVGAFCKTYDIYAAMDTWLPGVYEPTDIPGRYTFTGGSTTGGAVLYDDGRFLYSHHATDPCGGRLVNAFDLVRLHRFGDQDDDAAPGTPTNRLPSYTAMCEAAVADSSVSTLLSQERYAKATEAFTEAVIDTDAEWIKLLEINGQGGWVKSLKNVKTIITNDSNLAGKARLNLFTGRIDVCGPLPWGRVLEGGALWRDTDTTQLRTYLEPMIGKASKNDIADAVDACAEERAYHPVRDYLAALKWDGQPRLDTLLIDYLGAADTEYTRAVTRKAFVAAVARVMVPGTKYDTMLVLIGAQGRHKSTLLSKMGGAWFSDSLRTFDGKEAMETIQGTWINEIGEMQAMERSEVNAVKAFLSKQVDYYRAAYGRNVNEKARQCVFFGTTNSRDCLRDPTGGRRFWPVDIDIRQRGKSVFEHLDEERDQLWAEAYARWQMGEPLYLAKTVEAAAREEQESHTERHPWEGPIEAFLDKPVPADWQEWGLDRRRMLWAGGMITDTVATVQRSRICAVEVWCEMLGRDKSDLSQRITREINALLEKAPGWKSADGPRYVGQPYGKQRCFERVTATD